ncbi:hypothetical protein ALQ23_200399 [Pseudomonas syringae pv. antirrhini]|nr:hypothetical protein ALQ23_200399 [Pseudomonas syringae pv. antirrhini]
MPAKTTRHGDLLTLDLIRGADAIHQVGNVAGD